MCWRFLDWACRKERGVAGNGGLGLPLSGLRVSFLVGVWLRVHLPCKGNWAFRWPCGKLMGQQHERTQEGAGFFPGRQQQEAYRIDAGQVQRGCREEDAGKMKCRSTHTQEW